jgi:hypothetical protein
MVHLAALELQEMRVHLDCKVHREELEQQDHLDHVV